MNDIGENLETGGNLYGNISEDRNVKVTMETGGDLYGQVSADNELKGEMETGGNLQGNISTNHEVKVKLEAFGSGGITSNVIRKIIVLEKAEYEALPDRPMDTLFLIRG